MLSHGYVHRKKEGPYGNQWDHLVQPKFQPVDWSHHPFFCTETRGIDEMHVKIKLMMLKSGRRWPANKFVMTSRQSYSVSDLYFRTSGFQLFAAELSIQTVHAYLKTFLVLNFWSHCWSMCLFMSKGCIFGWKLPIITCTREMQLLHFVDCGLHLSQRTLGFFWDMGIRATNT